MPRALSPILCLFAGLCLVLGHCLVVPGCRGRSEVISEGNLGYFRDHLMAIEYPDAETPASPDTLETQAPFSLSTNPPRDFRPITLQEAVQTALAHSTVLRDVGGLVLNAPDSLRTRLGPALAETDPRFGPEAALSEFDAVLAAGTFFEKNDRAFNNAIAGLGTQFFQQDAHVYNFELRKRTAVGTSFAVRKRFDYDFNNSPFNNDPNLPWTMRIEGEVRQPLLQGAGVDFNRIAGTSGVPGFYNGVLITRINTDISLADFEMAVTQLVADVENAYWELLFAYRDLDAKLAARERAFESWRLLTALPGEAATRAAQSQALEQVYRLEAEVQDALVGRPQEKTNTNIFRGTGGVYASERRLRRAIGLPAADGQLLRPADEPTLARNVFSWEEALGESLARRVELRRQKWQVKRRELELIAARNYLLPKLDVVSVYRFYGIGHDLISQGDGQFDSALGNLTSGDFQEWAVGVEMLSSIGYRKGHAAVRHAELQLSRDRAVLEEQEQQVVSDLGAAFSELDRAHELMRTNFNRRAAASDQLQSITAVLKDADNVEKPRLLDLQLDAQRRLADAESQFFRALAEHEVAIKNVHLSKGSLLDYNQIYLTEGDWPAKAYADASRRQRLKVGGCHLDNYVMQDRIVSQGEYPQHTTPAAIGLPPTVPKSGDPLERLPAVEP
ncbi:MAG: TolC family protein [Planctomycetaceae bacterium]|nr:TolC family protein [Planctomycetaceae bacterium]